MKAKRILCVVLCATLLVATAIHVRGSTKLTVDNRNPYEQPILIRATCYTSDEGAITYSGQKVRTGIIAGKTDWQGSVALLYTYKMVGGEPIPVELIGIYEVLDTGAGIDTDCDGNGDSIINGQSIDIYQPTMHQAEEWIDEYGDYVMMMLVEGEG
jgi:3D (Asp-Asp-Asp) domain-containing protein